MGYYTQRHAYFCGIDLHARSMFITIQDASGETLVHQNVRCSKERLAAILKPYREDVVVACECTFSWYWLCDWCAEQNIPFALGHALGMRAIHQAKIKSDAIDATTICNLLRSGYFPLAYAYPKELRATRDLLRRRMVFTSKATEVLAHTQTLHLTHAGDTHTQSLRFKRHRAAAREGEGPYEDPMVTLSLNADIAAIDALQAICKELETHIERHANHYRKQDLILLRSIPGIGKILGLVLLYEIHDIRRFPSVGHFISYARLMRPDHESAGKRVGTGNRKIGNRYLRWAFGEAAVLFLRGNERMQAIHQRRIAKKGKSKALAILAADVARTVYRMLTTQKPFDVERFYGQRSA